MRCALSTDLKNAPTSEFGLVCLLFARRAFGVACGRGRNYRTRSRLQRERALHDAGLQPPSAGCAEGVHK